MGDDYVARYDLPGENDVPDVNALAGSMQGLTAAEEHHIQDPKP